MLATRLWQNTAKVHFDATARDDGHRLIYGGHVISLARALSFNGLANAQMHRGDQRRRPCQPVLRRRHGARLVRGAGQGRTCAPGVGALRLRLVATRGPAVRAARDGREIPTRCAARSGLLGADAGVIRGVLLCLGLVLASAARADYVASNLRFTLYHELGHAVIDQLALPVFGTQENAADSFAMVLADRLLSDAQMTVLIFDVTALARHETPTEQFDPWDEYMPGAQRLARAICLWFGLSPADRLETARALECPPDPRAIATRMQGRRGRRGRPCWTVLPRHPGPSRRSA